MYLFVYQNVKHQMTIYDPRRKNLASTYGQFDMTMLRRALKDRFTLWGHGTHPLQHLLNQLDMGDRLVGHIIVIEDPKIAVWLKLNYDRISRKIHNHGRELEFKGSYKDVKVDELEPLVAEAKEIRKQMSLNNAERQRVRMMRDSVQRFTTQHQSLVTHMTDDTIHHGDIFTHRLNEVLTSIDVDDIALLSRFETMKDQVLSYLDSHKLS